MFVPHFSPIAHQIWPPGSDLGMPIFGLISLTTLARISASARISKGQGYQRFIYFIYLGSKRAQGCPLVAEGCGTLLKMPCRNIKNVVTLYEYVSKVAILEILSHMFGYVVVEQKLLD
jgi:hypothetical protein